LRDFSDSLERMDIHKNARLTVHGRERVVRQEMSGQTPKAAALGGKDIFVHISAVERASLRGLSKGETVEFENSSWPPIEAGPERKISRSRAEGSHFSPEIGVMST
jgi:cold shock CspA family protein